jgi:hypothetical protein
MENEQWPMSEVLPVGAGDKPEEMWYVCAGDVCSGAMRDEEGKVTMRLLCINECNPHTPSPCRVAIAESKSV